MMKICRTFGQWNDVPALWALRTVFLYLMFDKDSKMIKNVEQITPPPHEPGLLPRWLGEKNVKSYHRRRNGSARAVAFHAKRDRSDNGCAGCDT